MVSGSNSGVFLVSNPDTLDLVYIYGVGNCANNDTVQLIINDLPVVEAGSNISLCVSDSIIFAGTPSGGTWSGDGITDPVGKFVGDSAAVGLHMVYYSYTDTNSCDNTDSLVVNVLALPLVNAGNDTILCNQPGVVDFDGNFNHCIIIRSFMSRNQMLHYQAGAGIVSKSVPENELQEVYNKLGALDKALNIAEKL